MSDSRDITRDTELVTQSGEIDSAVDEETGEGLTPKIARFLRLFWAKRKLVFTILVIGISISLVRELLQKNVYTATTSIMPPDGASSSSGLMSLMGASSSAASLSSEMLGLETPGELYSSILGSRNVLDGLVVRFDLKRYYHARMVEDARKILAASTKTTLDRKSGIITVSVTDLDPALAANLARGYVAELNRVLTEDSTSSAHRERLFLEGRLKEVKQQLDDSSRALSQFSTKSGAIDVPAQTRSMMETGLKLQEELITGRSQLAGLLQTYGEDNPRVRAVEAGNAELQKQIDKLGGLGQKAVSDSGAGSNQYPSTSQLPTLGLTYFDLERQVRVQEALWQALTRQYEAVSVQEAEQISSARVLDVAQVPERKSGPARTIAVMLGALLSLLVACVAVVTQHIWEEMDSGEEPKKLLLDISGSVIDHRRWYWSIPGLKGIRARLSA